MSLRKLPPFFSVIIPVYNRETLLRRAIESVVGQSDQDFELIVVDDGSTDASAQVAASTDVRCQVYQQKNLGPGPARNLGVKQASGKYVAFLDSDDIWFPWTLAAYRAAIEQHSNPPCLFGSVVQFSSTKNLTSVKEQPLRTRAFPDYFSTLGSEVYQGTGVAAIRADVIREHDGFFHERIFCEDLDFLMRMGTSGPIIHVEQPIMIGLFSHAESSITEIRRTYDGTSFLIRREKLGMYPGGKARRSERVSLLLHHIRGVLRACINQGEMRLAWKLYTAILRWMLERREFRAAGGLAKEFVAHRFGRRITVAPTELNSGIS